MDRTSERGDSARNEAGEGGAREIDRVNGFSDAVFAVAITLLILGISVPVLQDADQLPSALKSMWPEFFAFILSFVLIGYFWISHHRMFRYLRRYTYGLVWLNLLFLMFIVFLPFSTNLISEYDNSKVATVFYNANMALVSLTLCMLWIYMTRGCRLVAEDLDPTLRKHLVLVYLGIAAVFLASMGVAAISVDASQYLYFLLIPLSYILDALQKREMSKAKTLP